MPTRLNLIIVLVLILTGCAQPESVYGPAEAELKRVATILNLDPLPISVTQRTAALRPNVALSETRIALTEALSLGECGLVPLIAERNSALGRQKVASTRFIYEWRIRHGLASCVEQFGDEDWFQEAMTGKAIDVEHAAYLVLFEGDEAQQLNSLLPSSYARLRDSTAAYRDAFGLITPIVLQAIEGQTAPTGEQQSTLETALKHWGNTRHHATLSQAIRQTDAWLVSANTLLTKAIDGNRLCPMKQPTTEGRQIASFIQGYFATNIQPQIADVFQSVDALDSLWIPLRDASKSIQRDATPSQLLRIEERALETLRARWAAHVQGWQTILQQCQLAPRAATTNS